MEKHIRILVVADIKHPDGREFMNEFTEKKTNRKFYRRSGGGVNFGELAIDALRREFMEEYGLSVIIGNRLEVYENTFEYEGNACHEIVFVYEAEFEDKSIYSKEIIPNIEGEMNKSDIGLWIDKSKMIRDGQIYYKG
ncbi:MAG: NUDIX domain-containing protein [Alphaproteobacteria bacterium]|nr:NUDIX domain-containing protein [Alphaproteobacteria bacterium]